MSTVFTTPTEIIYPESDGRPMADNTKQFRWIVTIKENLELVFASRTDVFVAGDLLWYPVEGHPEIRQAPDVLVVIGRPKGDRGSYRQWVEDNVAPQVVFEVLSPGNRQGEMFKKLKFYERYGVEEYYLYDPDRSDISGWRRTDDGFDVIEEIDGWTSPLLGIRFQAGIELGLFRPDGGQFLTFGELEMLRKKAEEDAATERARADEERRRADMEYRRAERLAAKLRALGIDPDTE